MRAEKVLITKEGLQQLVQDLSDRKSIQFTLGKKFNRDLYPSEIERAKAFGLKSKKLEMPKYDPTQPMNFKFKILEQYLKDYEKSKVDAASNVSAQKVSQ